MKKRCSDLRRRRVLWAATTAACGIMAPAVASAALLNTNLVVNGNCETVDLASVGNYNGPKILNWVGNAFAYSHNGSSSSGGVVPDYADGADPPGAGNWYFTSNNGGGATDITGPGQFFQNIDVSTGPTATLITSGAAQYNLSAFMSSYLNDSDFGVAHIEFFNAGNGSLGTAQVADNDVGLANVWNQVSAVGAIPVGTASVRLSLYGMAANGGPDGYIDNVSFSVVPEPSAAGAAGALAALALVRRRPRSRGGPP